MNQPFSIIANDGQGGKYARIANSQVDLLLMLQEALQQGMTSIEIKTGDRYESDMNQELDGGEPEEIRQNESAPEPSAARLAINLMRVLDWKNPGGTIREAYIPGFLRDKCDEAIRLVPMDELRAEYERHSTLYPEGLVERWLRDSSQ